MGSLVDPVANFKFLCIGCPWNMGRISSYLMIQYTCLSGRSNIAPAAKGCVRFATPEVRELGHSIMTSDTFGVDEY